MNRLLRFVLIGLGVLVVLAAAGVAAVLLTFDPNRYKPDIEAAVAQATGRTLTLNGKIQLGLSLTPTLHVADAAFANPPGFSRPQMATLQALEMQIALLPLISGDIHIDRLVMEKPDILLETNASGQPNWQFQPQGPAGTAPPQKTPQAGSQPTGSQPGPTGGKTTSVSIETLSIRDGQVALRDDRTGKVTSLAVKTFDAKTDSPDAPVHLTMDGSYGGKAFDLTADTGPLIRLQSRDEAPWPVKATFNVLGATLSVDGTLGLAKDSYAMTVSGKAPDLSAFNVFVPTAGLPPVHDVRLDAKIAGVAAGMPDVSTLALHAGAADLGSYLPGLTLTGLDVTATAPDAPLQVKADGSRGGAPFALAGTLGSLAALKPQAKPMPFPIDATLTTAGATVSAKGQVADMAAQKGLNLGVNATIPDLAALGPLLQAKLPAVKQVAFKATVADAPNGLRQGVRVTALSLTSPDADLAGDVAVGLAPRVSVSAKLASNRIDLDALQAAEAGTKGAPPTGAAPATPPPPSPAPPAGPPPARPTPAAHDSRIFPDTPIPFGLLRSADADIALTVATLHASGADTKGLTVHAVLGNGRLSVDPLDADLPAGRMSGSLTADASQATPPVHIKLHAPGLALKTLMTMAGEPQMATGNLEVYADLSGAGASPHAIAGSLDGTLGLAVAGGTLDNRILGSYLGRILQAINLLDLVSKGGTSELRCFATHVRASHGTATIDPLQLSSSLLTMGGSGTANLGAETVDLGLKPQVRAAATTLVIPVNVSGPMRAPAVAVNKLGAAESNAGTVAGAVVGHATPLGVVGGLLGVDKAIGLTGGDPCPAALAAARGQAASPQAGASTTPGGKAPPAAPGQATSKGNPLSKPADALKSLFH